MIGKNNALTRITANILNNNNLIITDTVDESSPILQSNGVLQGDPLSPLLFNIYTADIIETIQNSTTKIYMYADDIALSSTNRIDLQESFERVATWAQKNRLTINKRKTVQMVFRKGGRLSPLDTLSYKGEQIQIVNEFKYLGVTLQTSTTSYRCHIKERSTAAIRAIYDIKEITRLSLNTAMMLFKAKIVPIATYGLEIIWEHLSKRDLIALEKVKSRFLKAALGVSKFTKSRIIYELARETFLLEDIRLELQLPHTHQYDQALTEMKERKNDIWEEFYSTDAMIFRQWTGANKEYRSAVTRLAVHGYHHLLCKNSHFHEPSTDCICSLCNKSCERYHFDRCKKRTKSLMEYSKE